MTVVDFRAAEGLVGLAFLQRGANCVHGFELDAHRVSIANGLCQAWAGTQYRQADLSDWITFESAHANVLRDAYDIVLYLGLHHHLPAESRLSTLEQALGRARRYFAIRTPLPLYETEPIGPLTN